MKTYTKPTISINYFEDIFTANTPITLSDPYTTNAAITMNDAVTTGKINAAAARTVRVQTILQFNNNG